MRWALLAVLAGGLSGCGAMVDLGYKLGDGKYRKSVEDSSPTAQSVERTEYEATVQPDMSLRLECYARTRQVERSWHVTKVYEYRGGFSRGTYLGTAAVDGLVAAIAGGAALGICLDEDSDTSCYHMLWASPWAIDLLYSLIRTRMVRDPVLVGKRRSGDQVRYAQAPLSEQAIDCPQSGQLWLGGASGPSEEDLLNGRGGSEARELGPGAVRVEVDADGLLTLSAEVAAYWASHSYARLWVSDEQAGLQPVVADRCGVLRPHAAALTYDQRQAFNRDCPLPQPTR